MHTFRKVKDTESMDSIQTLHVFTIIDFVSALQHIYKICVLT